MTAFLLNNTTVKQPKTAEWYEQDLDSEKSTRSASGKMNRDRIAQKVKFSLEWGPMNDADMAQVLTLLSAVFFSATYLDPKTAKTITKQFYSGDRKVGVYSWNDKYKEYRYSGLTVDIIEQ